MAAGSLIKTNMVLLIIILFLIAFALLLNALYKRTNSFRNQFVDVRKFAIKGGVGDNLEIVNLGSNHPKFGFDYSGIDLKGENWAVGPQTLEYDFSILRNNVSHLSSGAVVVIPICLLKMFLYRQEGRAIHVKYYSFLPPKDIVGYNRLEKWSNYSFPLLFHPRRLRSLIKDVKPDNRLLLEENIYKSEVELNKDADSWIDCWNKEFNIQLPTPTLSPNNRNDIIQNVRILGEMIDYCYSKGLKPVVTILPVTNYLRSRLTDEFVENHILGYIEDANKAGAPVLNYLSDVRFTDSALYINSFFFNSKGRKAFTKQFVEDLKDQSIL